MTEGGSRGPSSHGNGLLSCPGSTTTDSWPSGPTTCSSAGGRSPKAWMMTPVLEQQGIRYPVLHQDRRASLWQRVPQRREKVSCQTTP